MPPLLFLQYRFQQDKYRLDRPDLGVIFFKGPVHYNKHTFERYFTTILLSTASLAGPPVARLPGAYAAGRPLILR